MKLIFCSKCDDVFKPRRTAMSCQCGHAVGSLSKDGDRVMYGGSAVPLGIDNPSLSRSIENQPDRGCGHAFVAFVVAKHCPTFQRVEADAAKNDH